MQLLGPLALHQLSFAYFVINIDPVLVRLGGIAVHWYGLAYVVAISIALWASLKYTKGLGIHEDQVWGLFIWTAIGGLIGGRLYFVIQQPDLVQKYLLQPENIFAVWNGGMAFFGAIFLGTLTLFLLAPRYGMSRWIAIDGGALFAAVGQIFGRFGNIINGDILGQAVSTGPLNIPAATCAHAPCIAYISDPHILAWAEVYLNPNSFAPLGIAFQPAPVYEMGLNLIMLAILWPLRYRLPRFKAGLFFASYVALYAVSQLIVFFARGSEPITPFLGITIFKQAQWTAIVVLLLCIPLVVAILRYSRAWPFSDVNPVPWPPAAGVSSAEQPARTTGSVSDKSQLLPLSKTALATASDVAERPVWQPTRATGGRLRNMFGSTPPSEPPTQP